MNLWTLTVRSIAAGLVGVPALVGCASAPADPGPSISIARSGCYGRCPSYTFTLHANGRYVWVGRSDVSVKGTVRGKMNLQIYGAARRLLNDAHYLEFKDRYATEADCEVIATDHPSVDIVVAEAAQSKSIVHYLGCEGFAEQAALIQLENDLDTVLQTRRFTGVGYPN
jgi:hypothetical protein